MAGTIKAAASLKAGVLVFLVRFWKMIAVGLVAGGGFIMNLARRKKNEEPEAAVALVENNDGSDNV